MATTTNYSWTTPDDTALVKDGAAAIRSLGTAIDSTVFTNAGNAINKTLIDAKGDLIVGSAADTAARLAAGTNGYYLSANSGATNGLEWVAPPSSGGMTLITTTTFNNTANTYTYSSLGSYKHLMILLENASYNAGSIDSLACRFNSDTGANYIDLNVGSNVGSFSANTNNAGTYILLMYRALSASSGQTTFKNGSGQAWIYDYTGSQVKNTSSANKSYNFTDARIFQTQGTWDNTAAITSLTLFTESGNNFHSGTLKLYGVS